MLKRHDPPDVQPPFSLYSQGVEAPPGLRWLHISGQVAINADGSVPEGAEAQLEQIWGKILHILESAGMGPHDLVKITAYLTRREDTAVFRQVRDRLLDGAKPASSMIIVAGLINPAWVAEIDAVAAAE
jgi:2-iminobutanoate/2-iminopropanoate deaminase